jgi:lipopolysaccharide/colanic/teichoic acid biosynthesis glycosyltransferase
VNPNGWQFAVKHMLDRIGAGVALVVLAPLLLAIAAAVRSSSPGPVLFRQRRIGRDGRDFEMLKFRSMRPVTPGAGGIPAVIPAGVGPGGVEGLDRRTRIGTFLRRSSLDELPQLINVLRGEMSFVGPRPERPEFVGPFIRHVRHYNDRHRVRSGITGWAQVNGLRGQTSLSDRVEADNQYIESWSLALDLRILLMTVAALFSRAE